MLPYLYDQSLPTRRYSNSHSFLDPQCSPAQWFHVTLSYVNKRNVPIFNGFPGKKASLRMRANLLEKLPFLPLVVVVVVSLSDSLKVMVPNSWGKDPKLLELRILFSQAREALEKKQLCKDASRVVWNYSCLTNKNHFLLPRSMEVYHLWTVLKHLICEYRIFVRPYFRLVWA